MVQQKKLSTASQIAAVSAQNTDGKDELLLIVAKDLLAAMSALQTAEQELTRKLIAELGQEHIEEKVQSLQQLAAQLTELKKLTGLPEGQDDGCRV